MAGLLDFMNTPEGMGLLSAVAAGAAGARKGTPWNNAGRGALGGLMGYQQTKDNLAAAEENAFNKQFKQLQLDQANRAMRKEADTEAWRAGLPGLLKPQISDQGAMLNEQNAAFGDEGTQATLEAGQYAPNAQLRMTPQVDQAAVQDYMMDPASPFADKMLEDQVFGKKKDPIKLGAGDVLLDPVTMQPVYTAAPKDDPAKYSQDMNDYLNSYGIDPKTASREQLTAAYQAVQDMKTKRAQLSAQTVTLGSPQMFTTPEGQTAFVQPANRPGQAPQVTYLDKDLKPSTSDKPTTEAENTAAGFLGRMQAAEQLIQQNPGGRSTEKTNVAGKLPIVGGYAQRQVMTPEQQRYKQAADDWIRSKLRKESGAVIGADEMQAEYEVYFPQPGETDPTVIAQKAQARKQAEQQMRISAGRAAEKAAPVAKPTNKADGYRDYVDAYKRATTKAQRDAINARARELGVIK